MIQQIYSCSKKYYSKKQAEKEIDNLKSEESQIKRYLDLLDKNDNDDDKNPPSSFNRTDLENKLKNIKYKIKKFEDIEGDHNEPIEKIIKYTNLNKSEIENIKHQL